MRQTIRKRLLTTCLVICIIVSAMPWVAATSIQDHRMLREDTTPPTTICNLSGEMQEGMFTGDVTVTLTATDNESGVNATFIQLDGGNWSAYDVPLIVTAPGNHRVAFYSVDVAGNMEAEKNATFRIQPLLPITMTIAGGKGVTVTVTNTGAEDIVDVPYTITLGTGFYLKGRRQTGEVSVPANGSSTLVLEVLGLGLPTIYATVGVQQETAKAFVFIVFVQLLE